MRKTDIAWSRFGLGPRPGDEPLTDPIGWLRDQMDDYRPDLASTGALASRALASRGASWVASLVASAHCCQPPPES